MDRRTVRPNNTRKSSIVRTKQVPAKINKNTNSSFFAHIIWILTSTWPTSARIPLAEYSASQRCRFRRLSNRRPCNLRRRCRWPSHCCPRRCREWWSLRSAKTNRFDIFKWHIAKNSMLHACVGAGDICYRKCDGFGLCSCRAMRFSPVFSILVSSSRTKHHRNLNPAFTLNGTLFETTPSP